MPAAIPTDRHLSGFSLQKSREMGACWGVSPALPHSPAPGAPLGHLQSIGLKMQVYSHILGRQVLCYWVLLSHKASLLIANTGICSILDPLRQFPSFSLCLASVSPPLAAIVLSVRSDSLASAGGQCHLLMGLQATALISLSLELSRCCCLLLEWRHLCTLRGITRQWLKCFASLQPSL